MDKKIILFLFILFCGLMSCVLCGCQKGTIKFYRESGVQRAMKDILPQQKNDEVLKSSGIVIYRDNTSRNQNNTIKNREIHFGPRDINFDLPIKLK